MTPRALLIAGIAAFTVGLIACLPLSFFLPASGTDGLSYSAVRGTLWQGGSIAGVRYKGIPVGRVDIEPSLTGLLTGSLGGEIAVAGSFLNGSGHLEAGDNLAAKKVNIRVALSGLRLPVPLDGMMELSDFSARIEDGRCIEAAGNVRVSARFAGGSNAMGIMPVLTGPAVCENGEMFLRLQGSEAGTNLGLAAWIDPRGRYRIATDLATTTPEIRRILPYMGFVESGNSFKLAIEGRWQGE